MTAIDSTEAPIDSKIHDLSTEVEEAGHLLKCYMQLMFDANQPSFSDEESCRRSCDHTYALLTAVRVQIDRLQEVPEALIDCVRSLRDLDARRAA